MELLRALWEFIKFLGQWFLVSLLFCILAIAAATAIGIAADLLISPGEVDPTGMYRFGE